MEQCVGEKLPAAERCARCCIFMEKRNVADNVTRGAICSQDAQRLKSVVLNDHAVLLMMKQDRACVVTA